MKPQKNLTGQILVAIPNTHHSHFVRGLLLVTSHWSVGTSSVMFNKPLNTNYTVGSVLRNAGIECAVYYQLPIHQESLYPGVATNSDRLSKISFSVPNQHTLNDAEVEHIGKILQ